MGYENLIWEIATACANSLVVFTLLCIILDWCRSLLFDKK